MNVFRLRSVTASVISLWLGVFACLLGCATPMSAKTELRTSGAGAVRCSETGRAAEDSCCPHGHGPASSEKNRHQSMSCCPTETALIQKQAIATPALADTFVAILTLLNVDASHSIFANAPADEFVLWQAGREILRRVHVLRI
jgi:hypothetical protein